MKKISRFRTIRDFGFRDFDFSRFRIFRDFVPFEISSFGKFVDFNIYKATVPDRMHLLDLGITKYLLEFTCTYLQQKVSGKTVKLMDHRLSTIPRYPGLIILKNGLENISKFIANNYRNIMKVIIFVMDNLYERHKEGGIPCDTLCDMFYLFRYVYDVASGIVYRYEFGRITGKHKNF